VAALGVLRHRLLPPPRIHLPRNRTRLRSRPLLHRFMSRRYGPRIWSDFASLLLSSVTISTLFIMSFSFVWGVSCHHYSIAQHLPAGITFFYSFFLFILPLAYFGGGLFFFLMFLGAFTWMGVCVCFSCSSCMVGLVGTSVHYHGFSFIHHHFFSFYFLSCNFFFF